MTPQTPEQHPLHKEYIIVSSDPVFIHRTLGFPRDIETVYYQRQLFTNDLQWPRTDADLEQIQNMRGYEIINRDNGLCTYVFSELLLDACIIPWHTLSERLCDLRTHLPQGNFFRSYDHTSRA